MLIGDGIDPSAAIEEIVPLSGEKHIVEAVAEEIGIARTQDPAVFDVTAQGIGGEITVDNIYAANAGVGVGFDHLVTGTVDIVDVCPIATHQAIVASPAIQKIRTAHSIYRVRATQPPDLIGEQRPDGHVSQLSAIHPDT
ncbi:hypothetical protein D9M68_478480 [compost metagenome]